MTPKLRHRASVLKWMFPDCYQEVDGYWVWGPNTEDVAWGAFTAADLRVMAELLDEANRKWDAEIEAAFRDLDAYEPVELNVYLGHDGHSDD